MTCIAWDGKTLAADKQCTSVGHASTVTKIHRVDGGLVAFAGNASHARALLAWFKAGRLQSTWPASVRVDDCADAIFVTADAKILFYSGSGGGYFDSYDDKFIAMGAGRDYALAAMHLGRGAREAVEVVCALDITCGMGIDTLELE
jgi:ATP-dependent protease HslVU (ClpYQ) peptidase subunit